MQHDAARCSTMGRAETAGLRRGAAWSRKVERRRRGALSGAGEAATSSQGRRCSARARARASTAGERCGTPKASRSGRRPAAACSPAEGGLRRALALIL
eukprot:2034091-Prymnesium_polylepis.1